VFLLLSLGHLLLSFCFDCEDTAVSTKVVPQKRKSVRENTEGIDTFVCAVCAVSL